jgi:hypothetical protein
MKLSIFDFDSANEAEKNKKEGKTTVRNLTVKLDFV